MPIHDPAPAAAPERDKMSAAGNSVLAAFFLTGMKLVVGLVTGSLGILAEAAHSALDLVAALVTFLAVRVSGKPADREHPYGHGKIENFSALVETILLFGTCAWIVYESVERLFFRPAEIDPGLGAFLVMAVSIAVDISRSRMLYRAARKYRSQALEADALHFSTDVWSSTVVIGGLALVWLGKHVLPRYAPLLQKADALAAFLVALIVLFVSYRLGKRTIEALLDSAPEGLAPRIRAAAAGVEGVLDVGQIRVRPSGPSIFVDLTIDVDRNQSVERTHQIAEAVEAGIREIAPGADVVVHTDPREVEREALARRVRAVAYRNQMAVHNISLHEEGERISVDLHLEVDDDLSLEEAHELASHIERDLQEDMPRIASVTTHLESRGTGVDDGLDVTAAEPALVARITTVTDAIMGAPSCHDVSLRRRGATLSVALHCTFPKELSIVEVHDVSTRIEQGLLKRIPGLARVLVHAEPHER